MPLTNHLELLALAAAQAHEEGGETASAADTAIISAAISLKRIADCMTGDNPGIYDVFHDAAMAARVGWNR